MTLTSSPGANPRDAASPGPQARPLVIDAGPTLIACDLTLEALLHYLKLNPRRFLETVGWLAQGRDHLQRQLALHAPVDVGCLPVNEGLVAFAEAQARAGRPVYLMLAADSPLIERIAQRLPFVSGTIVRAPSQSAADTLAQRFPQGFEYAGGSAADLGIWRRASGAILVGAPRRLRQDVAALVPVSAVIAGPAPAKGLLASLRLHQWVKNLLVFAPIVLGGQLDNMQALLATIVAFLALGLVASSTYLVNDILDVADDRQHWSKRERPIARGLLRASTAAAWAGAGLAAGLALAATVSAPAVGILVLYIGLTLSYSLALKRLPLVDGLVLAIQFTLRLALGVVAAQVPPSPWLFVFSMFLFTSLSLAKRYTELGRSGLVRGAKIAGRGYRAEDAPLVLAMGVAAGLGAVVIVILYIIDDAFRQSFYGTTASLWGFPPLVFLLVCRIWLVTVRDEMHDDPVRFMLKDRACQALLALLATCFLVAWLG